MACSPEWAERRIAHIVGQTGCRDNGPDFGKGGDIGLVAPFCQPEGYQVSKRTPPRWPLRANGVSRLCTKMLPGKGIPAFYFAAS